MIKNVTPWFVPFEQNNDNETKNVPLEQKNDNETKNIWTNLFYNKKEPKF